MFKTSGIERIDRFVFDAGRCSFKARTGKDLIINGHLATTKPHAHVAAALVAVLAEEMKSVFGINIEVELQARGFTYYFRPLPKESLHISPRPVLIGIEATKNCFARAHPKGPTPPDRMPEYIDLKGAAVIQWFLERICDNARFAIELAPEHVAWKPL